MSTIGTIGYEAADGSFVGVYCHYDCDFDYMLPTLRKMLFVDVVLMVNTALSCGGIRSINCEGRPSFFFGERPTNFRPVIWPDINFRFAYRKRLDGSVDVRSDDSKEENHEELPNEWQ